VDGAAIPYARPLRQLHSGMKVFVTKRVLAQISAQGDAHAPLETGGVLLGWRDSEDKVIAGLIGPGPQALHGRHAFMPDHEWQVQEIHRAFKESNGDLDYLGDWHTHPGGVAAMSMPDWSTLSRMVRKNRGAIMLIAASDDSQWVFGSWTQDRNRVFQRSAPTPCSLRSIDAPLTWPTFDERPYPPASEARPRRVRFW
jgi:integrative and conjugative element protein (TIGR02256 family)